MNDLGREVHAFEQYHKIAILKLQKLYRTAGKKHRGVFHRGVKLSDRVVRCVSEQYRFPFSSVLDGHILPLMVLLGERELS